MKMKNIYKPVHICMNALYRQDTTYAWTPYTSRTALVTRDRQVRRCPPWKSDPASIVPTGAGNTT